MTIKKKDGNVYILEGPNKLAKNQEKIDLSKCVFHNFSWDEIVWKGKSASKVSVNSGQTIERPAPPKSSLPEFPIPKPMEKEEPIVEAPKIEVPKQAPKVEKQKEDSFNFPILKVKVLMHCLPAKVKTHKDLLYGDSWERVVYGDKFVFPSVMISNNDLQMQFWTSDPNSQISEKSIIYPFSYEIYNQNTQDYDKVPFNEHRWWKVSSKEEKEGGWLFSSIPSQDHPDFSD